jgi:hypothetical protein
LVRPVAFSRLQEVSIIFEVPVLIEALRKEAPPLKGSSEVLIFLETG